MQESQSSAKWHMHAREIPYALGPISDVLPMLRLEQFELKDKCGCWSVRGGDGGGGHTNKTNDKQGREPKKGKSERERERERDKEEGKRQQTEIVTDRRESQEREGGGAETASE